MKRLNDLSVHGWLINANKSRVDEIVCGIFMCSNEKKKKEIGYG